MLHRSNPVQSCPITHLTGLMEGTLIFKGTLFFLLNEHASLLWNIILTDQRRVTFVYAAFVYVKVC